MICFLKDIVHRLMTFFWLKCNFFGGLNSCSCIIKGCAWWESMSKRADCESNTPINKPGDLFLHLILEPHWPTFHFTFRFLKAFGLRSKFPPAAAAGVETSSVAVLERSSGVLSCCKAEETCTRDFSASVSQSRELSDPFPDPPPSRRRCSPRRLDELQWGRTVEGKRSEDSEPAFRRNPSTFGLFFLNVSVREVRIPFPWCLSPSLHVVWISAEKALMRNALFVLRQSFTLSRFLPAAALIHEVQIEMMTERCNLVEKAVLLVELGCRLHVLDSCCAEVFFIFGKSFSSVESEVSFLQICLVLCFFLN